MTPKERQAVHGRKHYDKKKAERATWSTEQQEAYKEQTSESSRRYCADNRERRAETQRKYRVANKAEVYRRNSERSRFLRNYKTTDFDKFVLEESWVLAREREAVIGGVWHVDHIIPVKHRKACGLNAAINLQVVPAEWNLSKGNRSMSVWLPKPSPNEP